MPLPKAEASPKLKRKDAKAEAEIRALYDFCRNVINNVETNVKSNVGSGLRGNVVKGSV